MTTFYPYMPRYGSGYESMMNEVFCQTPADIEVEEELLSVTIHHDPTFNWKETADAVRSPLHIAVSERDIEDAVEEYQRERVHW